MRNTCMRCGKFYEVKAIQESDGIPRCVCGGIIKPDVVLYEEGLDQRTMEGAAVPLPMLIFSSWVELRSRFIPLRDWCVTMPETG